MSRRALRCIEIVEIVTDYLEGAMSGPDRERFDEHVRGCEGCTRYLHQMRETIRLTGMLTPEQIPDEQMEELRSAFADWRAR